MGEIWLEPLLRTDLSVRIQRTLADLEQAGYAFGRTFYHPVSHKNIAGKPLLDAIYGSGRHVDRELIVRLTDTTPPQIALLNILHLGPSESRSLLQLIRDGISDEAFIPLPEKK
jgi:hypothetical protein